MLHLRSSQLSTPPSMQPLGCRPVFRIIVSFHRLDLSSRASRKRLVMHMLTKAELTRSPQNGRPHVVLLGAGASRAAFPDGDRHDRSVPLMPDLADLLGPPWTDLLARANPPVNGFERQFTWLRHQNRYTDCLHEIERSLFDYFVSLALPDRATVYDHLVLGLRQKDVIATFNWDPFLLLAHRRNRLPDLHLPDIRFLHGCVLYASCIQHSEVLGSPGEICPRCNESLTRSSLIFPVEDKNYVDDRLIAEDWRAVTDTLPEAFQLTIFGYSGPSTDHQAKTLLQDAWGASATDDSSMSSMRQLSHLEIIDTVERRELYDRWKDLIPLDHLIPTDTFWESSVARWPRRTAEAKLQASIFARIVEPLGPCRTTNLEELQEFHMELARVEREKGVE